MPKAFIFVSILVALVAFACGSDSDEPEAVPTAAGTPTDAEQAYLDDVAGVAVLIGEKFAHFGEIIDQVFPTREALFGALAEAGAGTAFDSGLEALEALEPPERFREEHELALDGLRELQRVDRQVGEAVENNDIIAFALANVQLGAVSVTSALQHSELFCRARFPLAANLCERPDFSSAGEYGEDVYAIMGRIESEAMPTLAGQIPALNEEEILEVLDTLGPAALDVLEQSREDAGELEPPAGLEADHERLIQYLDGIVDAATELREAAERRDRAAYMTQQRALMEAFCTAQSELSPAIAPFLVVHFGAPIPCEEVLP